ncbi:vanadium-dependent haloperoxidase [Terrimonas pollutisoli]|uniref:vanadium-dependent haloperoxidase n=1 Tax=Terrimonas pollutisoli TaxID=3034147 RepID=UPI0023EC023D|nr:vanadium-dependent haloperoxidase [Terrimonas sp. H1YJ31]
MKRLGVIILFFCNTVNGQNKEPLPVYLDLQPAVFSLSMVMMHDVVNPPAASRFYTYAMLGAYEIVAQNKAVPSLSAFLKNYTGVKLNSVKTQYDHRIAAVYCILETGKQMLPSGFMLQKQEDEFLQKLKKSKIPKSIIDESIAVANLVAGEIVAYAKTDGYGKLSAKLRYTPVKEEGYWYPTPPAYMEAVEPNWKTIRPILIDSCNQFPPEPPVVFSKDSSSVFYKMAKEVYDISKKPTPDQLLIASFWDCNPFVVATSGHMSLGFKKISPGGHWMNITSIVAKKAALDFDHSVLLHTILSATIMDAFISCWDEKYRSNRMRPETYINKYIDINWLPILQTPPFPEYTSGHSVISTASAEVLSYMLGDKFSYTDNTEDMFEIPARTFQSFRQAADEAAISRLYGGIHYRDAIVNGQQQGKAVGNKIVEKIKKAGITPLINSSVLNGLSAK